MTVRISRLIFVKVENQRNMLVCNNVFTMCLQHSRTMRERTMMESHSAPPQDRPGPTQKETTLMMR